MISFIGFVSFIAFIAGSFFIAGISFFFTSPWGQIWPTEVAAKNVAAMHDAVATAEVMVAEMHTSVAILQELIANFYWG